METRYMPKELGLFYVVFLTVPLYIQWEQFIIFQVTLPTPSYKVPSNLMLVFKSFYLNLLNIVTLLTLKVVLGDHTIRLKTIQTIFRSKFVKINPQRNSNIFVPTIYVLLKQTISQFIYQPLGHVYISRLKRMARKILMEGLPTNITNLEQPWTICLLTNITKFTRGPTIDVSKFAPGFMLQMDFSFFNI